MSAMTALMPLVLAQAAPTAASIMLENHALEMPQSLWYAASHASGVWYCDRSLKGPQARRFDSLYGDRTLKLAAAMQERVGLGWAADDIIVSTCTRETRSQRAKALRDFGKQLTEWEAEYLPLKER